MVVVVGADSCKHKITFLPALQSHLLAGSFFSSSIFVGGFAEGL